MVENRFFCDLIEVGQRQRGGVAVMKKLAQTLCCLFFRIEHHGLENLPRRGPCVIAANHQTFLDPIFVGACLPWRIRFLARGDLFQNPFFGRLIRYLGAFPIERGSPHKSAYLRCKEILAQDKDYLVVFPEGQRSRDGLLSEFKSGAIRLALAFEATIVPCSILGGFHVWPPQKLLPRPGKIHVIYHPPIYVPRDDVRADKNEKDLVADLMEKLEQRIATPNRRINFLTGIDQS